MSKYHLYQSTDFKNDKQLSFGEYLAKSPIGKWKDKKQANWYGMKTNVVYCNLWKSVVQKCKHQCHDNITYHWVTCSDMSSTSEQGETVITLVPFLTSRKIVLKMHKFVGKIVGFVYSNEIGALLMETLKVEFYFSTIYMLLVLCLCPEMLQCKKINWIASSRA